MLAKLLKYEMKAPARTLVPLYIGTLVVALVCALMLSVFMRDNGAYMYLVAAMYGEAGGILATLGYLLFFALCVAITVLTIMIIIQRFNKSLVGDEGYLMFTLPVTHTQLLGSKLAGAMLWSVIGIFVMFLSLMIISMAGVITGGEMINWNGLWKQFDDIIPNIIWPMLISLIYGFFSLASTILLVYLSIMIAQTEKLNNHRVAAAVILFFVIGWFFGGVESLLFMDISGIAAPDGFNIYKDFMWAYNMAMACQIAFEAVKCVICFMGTKWLMQKKLNL